MCNYLGARECDVMLDVTLAESKYFTSSLDYCMSLGPLVVCDWICKNSTHSCILNSCLVNIHVAKFQFHMSICFTVTAL